MIRHSCIKLLLWRWILIYLYKNGNGKSNFNGGIYGTLLQGFAISLSTLCNICRVLKGGEVNELQYVCRNSHKYSLWEFSSKSRLLR